MGTPRRPPSPAAAGTLGPDLFFFAPQPGRATHRTESSAVSGIRSCTPAAGSDARDLCRIRHRVQPAPELVEVRGSHRRLSSRAFPSRDPFCFFLWQSFRATPSFKSKGAPFLSQGLASGRIQTNPGSRGGSTPWTERQLRPCHPPGVAATPAGSGPPCASFRASRSRRRYAFARICSRARRRPDSVCWQHASARAREQIRLPLVAAPLTPRAWTRPTWTRPRHSRREPRRRSSSTCLSAARAPSGRTADGRRRP